MNIAGIYRAALTGRIAAAAPSRQTVLYSVARRQAWRDVRDQLSWSIAYDVAAGVTPNAAEVEAWRKIGAHVARSYDRDAHRRAAQVSGCIGSAR